MTPQPQEPLVTTSSPSKLLEHLQRRDALEKKKRSYVDFTFPSLPPRKKAIRSRLLSALFPYENFIRTQPLRKKEQMNSLVSAALGGALIASLFVGFLFNYTIIPALIVASSMVNLGLAIYDYVKTPKNERTPLQKFNLASSSGSTLLTLGLLASAICLSLAVPGAAFAFLAIIPVIAGFKYWQSYKAGKLKKQEDVAIEKAIKEENQAIEDLKHTATSLEDKIALTGAELQSTRYQILERKGAGLLTGDEYFKLSDLAWDLENEFNRLVRQLPDSKSTTAPAVTDVPNDKSVTVKKTECSSKLSNYSGTLFAQPQSSTIEGPGQPVCLPLAP